jgi:hypothetical protein
MAHTEYASPPLQHTPDPSTPSITNLVTGILEDGRTLAKQQMEMFKSEVREDLQHSILAAQYGGIGIVLGTVGALGFITALVYLLHEQVGLQMWISWGIIGLAFSAAGVVCAVVSNRLINKFNPLPDKTFNAIKENITWNTKK